MSRLLLLLLGAVACTPAATIFDLTSNTGLNLLFTPAGTDFLDIDGNGLNMNVKGTVILGSLDSIGLAGRSVLRIGSSRRSAIKVDYELALTFSTAVSSFYFGTSTTTKLETFTLSLTPNPGGGSWSQNLLYPGTFYSSSSGLGSSVFSATGPSGGNPASSITLTGATVLAAHYRMEKIGSSTASEDLFWGRYPGASLPPGPVPEPSTFLISGLGLIVFYLWMRKRKQRPRLGDEPDR